MKPISRILIALALLGALACSFTGCAPADPDSSELPWSRPHDWEQKVPGMPGG